MAASPFVVTARRLADSPWGRRYARLLAVECDAPLPDAAAALEASLARLLPRVELRPDRLFPRLTGAWLDVLFKDAPPPPNDTERRVRESKAIRAFARRVRERREPRLLDALSAELRTHFLNGS
ncbi:MAG TPA: hypothetical protein VF950_14925 [Planctomycetota bacterium]